MGRSGLDRAVPGGARQGLGMLVFLGLTALLVFAPTYLSTRLRPGAGEEAWSEPSNRPRTTVGARMVESRFSDGFEEVAAEVAEAPEATSWEALRALLEKRGRTDLWYSIRVAWLMDDGSEAEVTYVRQPYHDRYHFLEFVQLSRGQALGPETIWTAAWGGDGEPGSEHQGRLPETLLEKLLTSSTIDQNGFRSVNVR
ncbi:hypothetical protein [Paludisphaera soli]|uniref:hypothetical protein n=1 Tax=Paludisphaera soli TaxID=2712865 RepID=UPI0013E9BE3F|nr:hypothetical protein [Paludisphaera soli]